MEYLRRVRMVIHSHVGCINLTDPANIRQIHRILMNEVRNEATYISNKYKIQIDTMQFKWEKLLPNLEKYQSYQ